MTEAVTVIQRTEYELHTWVNLDLRAIELFCRSG